MRRVQRFQGLGRARGCLAIVGAVLVGAAVPATAVPTPVVLEPVQGGNPRLDLRGTRKNVPRATSGPETQIAL